MSAVTSLEANRKHLHVARGRYAERLKVQHAAPKIGDELHPIGFNRSERSQPIVRWLSSFRLLAVCLLSLPDGETLSRRTYVEDSRCEGGVIAVAQSAYALHSSARIHPSTPSAPCARRVHREATKGLRTAR
jgi:hypothetical protein